MSGLLIYNAGVVVITISGRFGLLTPPLWAAAVLHGAMTVWCLMVVSDQPERTV